MFALFLANSVAGSERHFLGMPCSKVTSTPTIKSGGLRWSSNIVAVAYG